MPLLLTTLDSQISTNLVIWAFPLAFLIHDLEEIFTMESFARENQEGFPGPFKSLASITTKQFTKGVAVLFVLTTLAAFLATRPQREMT